MSWRSVLFLAAINGFIGLAAGAFGAHGLKGRLDDAALGVFDIAVRYQMYHAIALLATTVLMERRPSRVLAASAWACCSGIVVFSGSLYVLALGGARWWGAITPIGGVALLIGWLLLAVAAARGKSESIE
ncbi:MAG: DUF423 domain-containing protein [Phycisphaerae bacterium]